MSGAFAGVTETVYTAPLFTSAPTCTFIPKYYWLPFLVWCIWGSRTLALLLVEGEAWITVVSTMLPPLISAPFCTSAGFIVPMICLVSACFFGSRRNLRTVSSLGIVPCAGGKEFQILSSPIAPSSPLPGAAPCLDRCRITQLNSPMDTALGSGAVGQARVMAARMAGVARKARQRAGRWADSGA